MIRHNKLGLKIQSIMTPKEQFREAYGLMRHGSGTTCWGFNVKLKTHMAAWTVHNNRVLDGCAERSVARMTRREKITHRRVAIVHDRCVGDRPGLFSIPFFREEASKLAGAAGGKEK